MIPVLRITDLELFKIGLVVHVPPEDHRAEAEAFLCDTEKFLLGDEFATEDAIDINARDLHFRVILEEFGQGFERYFGCWFGSHLVGV